jgi:hypothetical protein
VQLKEVNEYLTGGLGTLPLPPKNCQTISNSVTVQPGSSAKLELDGPRAIVALRVRMKFAGREDEMAGMRNLVLSIRWDDESKPSVWCPVGDFFGTAPGVNLYKSLTTGMTDQGGYAFWYMPFAKKAVLELTNEDRAARSVEYEVTHAPLQVPLDQMGYFHCKWHRDVDVLPEDRWPDWTMLRTTGRGRFCGVMLHVWNPLGGWWGEGDEKFFVDGEKFPSTFGTGSEDYFGYAWCNPGLFQRPYHCQTMTMGNKGHQSVLRWHVGDNVPFQSSFEGCIEKYYRTEKKGTQYALTAVWYLAAKGDDPYQPVAASQRHGYYDTPQIVAGGFKIVGAPPGNVDTQPMSQFKGRWQNGDQLWWTRAKLGDKLKLLVTVREDGTYDLKGVFTKARNYGIVRLELDGQKAGETIDLYSPSVVRTEPIALGRHTLKAGDHVVTVEIVGANDAALKNHMFGLDELILEPAK